MLELRDEEFSDLFKDEKETGENDGEVTMKAQANEKLIRDRHLVFVNDCQVDTDLEILFPDDYIRDVSERVRLYRELDNTETEEKLSDFEQQLVDRFGPLPEPTSELLNVVRLRWKSKSLGFEKIVIRNGKLFIYFVANQMSPYYQSPVFEQILHFVQNKPNVFQMKETKEKLTMTAEKVTTISKAMKLLESLSSFEMN
jgi:transcription-repair coupling factor (superfamily II helicase)